MHGFDDTIAPSQDPIRAALITHKLTVQDHYLFDQAGSGATRSGGLYIGPHFRICSCELIYRLTDAHDLLLVLYRRLEKKPSLGNPFADLIWFLQLATEPRFRLRRVLGFVSNFGYRHENGLSEERLVRFYQRFFHANWVCYDGHNWLCQDACALRERLTQVAHRATRV